MATWGERDWPGLSAVGLTRRDKHGFLLEKRARPPMLFGHIDCRASPSHEERPI